MSKKITISSSIYLYLIFFFALIFTSCEPEIEIQMTGKESANLFVKLSTGATIEKSLASILELQDGVNLFDEKSVITSAAKSNFRVTSVSFPSQTGINLSMYTQDLKKSFGGAPETFSLTDKNLSLKISKESVAEFLSILPKESSDYLELLMAPIFTDEQMSSDEYIELIGAVYGKTLANEMANSVVKITLISKDGKKKVFTPKLAEILCLENPQIFSIDF